MHMYKGFWYPDSDTKLKQVHDWVEDINVILKHVDTFDVCIQAGGAVGVWPARLAERFNLVFTFEPVHENYECLKKNIPRNVIANEIALGDQYTDAGTIGRDATEKGNSGAWFVAPGDFGYGEHTDFMYIDKCQLNSCDLICLDVEGSEYDVLIGGEQTIKKFKPVICIEEKPLPHMEPGAHLRPRQLLESWGYKQVDAVHRDVIFKC